MAAPSDGTKEAALLDHVQKTTEKGDPQSVLDAIDGYAQHTWFMNIGNDKGLILDAAVRKCNPTVVLEIGTYCGYSAIRIASQFTNPDSKLFSLEINPTNARIARDMIQHAEIASAGVSSKVEVIEGNLSERLDELWNVLRQKGAPYFDFVFLDHFKQFYLGDFLLLKEKKLIGKGTVIVADNMRNPGAPDFLDYLRTHPQELETQEYESNLEYMPSIPDMVTISTYLAQLH